MIAPLSDNMGLRTSHQIAVDMNGLQRAITPTVLRVVQ